MDTFTRQNMDRNPLLQGLRNPIQESGIVPGKVMPDWDTRMNWMANADDPAIAVDCYAGGNKDINHDAVVGDISLGIRYRRNTEAPAGEPNELGVTSVAGLYVGQYYSKRAMEDQFYFQGVVATPDRASNPNDPSHGYAIVRAGTKSVINNGSHMIYPGQMVCWRFPDAGFGGEEGSALGGSRVNPTARGGVAKEKWGPEYVPFDHTSMSTQFAAAYANAATSKNDTSDPGSADLTLEDYYARSGLHESAAISPLQEMGFSFSRGFAAIGLAMVQTLLMNGELRTEGGDEALSAEEAGAEVARIAGQLGLFDESGPMGQAMLRQFMAATMMRNLVPDSPERTTAERNFWAAYAPQGMAAGEWNDLNTTGLARADVRLARLMANAGDIAISGYNGAIYSNWSRVIGRSLNAAAPADTLDLLLGHTL